MNPSRGNGLVSTADIANLRRCAQESDADEDEESDLPKSGSWKPQVHFVWDMLLDQVLPKPGVQGERAPKGTFPEFFRIVVDGLSRPRCACFGKANARCDIPQNRCSLRRLRQSGSTGASRCSKRRCRVSAQTTCRCCLRRTSCGRGSITFRIATAISTRLPD